MFKRYFKCISHIIIFSIEMTLLLTTLILFFIGSLITIKSGNPDALNDTPLLNATLGFIGASFLFTIVFVTDLLVYLGQKHKYNNYIASQNNSNNPEVLKRAVLMNDEVKNQIELEKQTTSAYLNTDELIFENEAIYTEEDAKKAPVSRASAFLLNLDIRKAIFFLLFLITFIALTILRPDITWHVVLLWVWGGLCFLLALAYFGVVSKAKKIIKSNVGKISKTLIYKNKIETLLLNQDGSVDRLTGQVMFANATVKEDKDFIYIKGSYNNQLTVVSVRKCMLTKEAYESLVNEYLCYTEQQKTTKKGGLVAKFIGLFFVALLIVFGIFVTTFECNKKGITPTFVMYGGDIFLFWFFFDIIASIVYSFRDLKKWGKKKN